VAQHGAAHDIEDQPCALGQGVLLGRVWRGVLGDDAELGELAGGVFAVEGAGVVTAEDAQFPSTDAAVFSEGVKDVGSAGVDDKEAVETTVVEGGHAEGPE